MGEINRLKSGRGHEDTDCSAYYTDNTGNRFFEKIIVLPAISKSESMQNVIPGTSSGVIDACSSVSAHRPAYPVHI